MLTIIQIALGVGLGSTLAMGITLALMCNPKFMAWLTTKYIEQIEKVTETLTEKMEEKEL